MATIHSGIRAYAFECTYNSSSWVDDPSNLISSIQSVLSSISGFSYQQLKVANVKNTSGSNIEVEIIGITYSSKTKLSAAEVDDLIFDLNTALLTVQNFTFMSIDICTDVFRESPTLSWPDSSWKRG